MTANKKFKRLVRARAEMENETYQQALAVLTRNFKPVDTLGLESFNKMVSARAEMLDESEDEARLYIKTHPELINATYAEGMPLSCDGCEQWFLAGPVLHRREMEGAYGEWLTQLQGNMPQLCWHCFKDGFSKRRRCMRCEAVQASDATTCGHCE